MNDGIAQEEVEEVEGEVMTPDEFDFMMMNETNDEPIFPLNRIVAFFGPYISLLAGFISTWLVSNVAIFNTLNVSQDDLMKTVTELIVFALVSGLTWLGQRKWLQGHIQWEKGQLDNQRAAIEGHALIAAAPPTKPEVEEYDEEAAVAEMKRRTQSTPADTKPGYGTT